MGRDERSSPGDTGGERKTNHTKMDPEAFLDLANQVTKLKMYPYFDLAHAALCCLAVRDDLANGSLPFSRKHPLALWVSSMLVIFAGGILANLLLGEPVLAPLKNNNQLLLSTIVWYLIFYSPFDVGYKFFKFLPIKVICAALKEVYRAKKVHDGVTHAAKLLHQGQPPGSSHLRGGQEVRSHLRPPRPRLLRCRHLLRLLQTLLP